MPLVLASAQETAQFGAALAPRLQRGDIIGLSGALGTGKTTFARGLIGALGFLGEVVSPSFGLAIPYDGPEMSLPVLHIDLYRLANGHDIGTLGIDDMLEVGAVLVEWPEHFSRGWPNMLRLTLKTMNEGARRLTADVPPSWEGRWI